MKKLLLFLVLFGAGLAVLTWLEEDTDPGPDPGSGSTPPVDLPPGTDGIGLRGRAHGTIYDPETRSAILQVESEDSITEQGVDRFLTVLFRIFDDSGEQVATLKADEARIRRTGGSQGFQPDYERRAELDVVEADFVSGVPIAPMHVITPSTLIDASDPRRRRLVSDAVISFDSEELDGGGEGYLIELDRDRLELHDRGWVELHRPGEASVRFTSRETGPLSILREPDGDVILYAGDGATLNLFGELDSTLTAEGWIRIQGREDENGVVQIDQLTAEGTVVWTYGENEFRSGRAKLVFDDAGNLVRAELSDTPSARLTLLVEDELIEGVDAAEAVSITVRGNELIEIHRRDDGTEFEVDGPAEVEMEGIRLRSNGELTGLLNLAQTKAEFEASDGVVVEGENGTLETADFKLVSDTDADGERILSGFARGGARLEGLLEAGRRFTVTSPDRLHTVRRGMDLRLVDGTDVDISIEGEDGFRAHADRVQNFDVNDLSFIADGDVVFEGDQGRAEGEHLESLGPARFILTGPPGGKASFDGPSGQAEADVIERDGTQVHARGGVVADLVSVPADGSTPALGGLDFDRYHLECDDVLFERTTTADGEQTVARFWMEAQGNVKSRVVTGSQVVEVRRASRLTADRTERPASSGKAAESVSILHVERNVQVDLSRSDGEVHLSCNDLVVEQRSAAGQEPTQNLVARGAVRFRGRTDVQFSGTGEILQMSAAGIGHLEAPVSGQVELFGILPSSSVPFRLTGTRVDFSEQEIVAENPEVFFRTYQGQARRMVATVESVDMIDSVRFTGLTTRNQPWSLVADRARMEGRADSDSSSTQISSIDASGNIEFVLGDMVRAYGDRITGGRAAGILRMTGSPARIVAPLVDYEAEWIEFDPELQIVLATGAGRVRPQPQEPADEETSAADQQAADKGWALEFLSSSTLVEPDSLIYILQEPIFRHEELDTTMRASWSVLWIDRERWQEFPDSLGREGAAQPQEELTVGGPMRIFFQYMRTTKAGDLVREGYFEGPVEVLTAGEVVAHADAVYCDLVTGHGWLANATVNARGPLGGGGLETITVKADWLRHSSDGSLRADSATVTSCDFDEPHIKVVTGDLRLIPAPGTMEQRFQVSLSDNRIEAYNRLKIPLPPIAFDTDEELEPLWPSLSIANTARFGSLLGLEFSGPANRVTEAFEDVLGEQPGEGKVRSEYAVDAKYLGSRGGLLDLGLMVHSKDRYWVDVFVGSIFDTGEDKGFIRVPTTDRGDGRFWTRSHGSFEMGKSKLNFNVTTQTDLGVQSEFYENRFLVYEENESFIQWKRSSQNTYVQASGKVRLDSFRTDVEELPNALGFLGRSELFEIGSVPFVHTGTLQAGFLERFEGNSTSTPLASPFGRPAIFPDGLGDRDVARADTVQTIEAPISIGFGGIKLTPFSTVRATFWDESVDPDEPASRVVATAGARLGTTFWKRGSGKAVHQIAPYAQFSNELLREETQVPVAFDQVEADIFGNFVELGLRSRIGSMLGSKALDIDLRGTFATDRSDGTGDGWLPFEVYGRLELEKLGRLFEIWHDGRYDFDAGETVYSLAALGTRLSERAGVQFGHQYGRDRSLQKVFDALSVAGYFRWTQKWEFEAQQSFSLLEDLELGFGLIVRRYGHDAIFELNMNVREGEGTSIGVSLRPLLGYRPTRIGYLNW